MNFLSSGVIVGVALAVGMAPAAWADTLPPAQEVVFTPEVIDRDTHCIVGFAVTYPQDVAPHGRQIRVTTVWSETIQDDVWQVPPRGAPDSFTQNSDGTVTFSGAVNESVGGCDRELTERTLAIGPCAEGDCPPARFVSNENAERLGLRETDY